MKAPTQKEEVFIYRHLLIKLNAACLTGDDERVKKILDAIGAYSYARTNSNPGNEKQECREQIRTLLNLKNL